MKKIKYSIIIIGILIICMLVTTLVIIYNNQKTQVENVNQDGSIDNTDNTLKKQDDRNLYYSIESTINDYLMYIVGKNNEAIYNTLSDDYIQENDITLDNILTKIDKIETFDNFLVSEMYMVDRKENCTNYVHGVISYNNTNYDWYCIFDTDYEYYTITPCNKQRYEEIIENEIDTGKKDIKQNSYSIFNIENIPDMKMARNYLMDYITKALNNPEEAYDLLDEEYRNKRFLGLEDYKKYIESNKENLQNAVLKKYLFEYKNHGNTCQITLCDTYDNYYIVYENAILDYTIKLDNYTIKTEDFNEQYEKLSDKEKVKTNIEQFISMINTKDYNNLYSLLEENFKNTNFSSEELLEQFLKQNYFDYNILIVKSITKNENAYKCNIVLKDNVSSVAEEKSKVIYIYLQEGTDFKIAFEG